jgi:hypothetical protein
VPQNPTYTYFIWRRNGADTSWGSPVASVSNATRWVDFDASPGGVNDYRILRVGGGGGPSSAYGFISVAWNKPEVHSRGNVLLVVDQDRAPALEDRLDRLKWDLIGDGYQVYRIELSGIRTKRFDRMPEFTCCRPPAP